MLHFFCKYVTSCVVLVNLCYLSASFDFNFKQLNELDLKKTVINLLVVIHQKFFALPSSELKLSNFKLHWSFRECYRFNSFSDVDGTDCSTQFVWWPEFDTWLQTPHTIAGNKSDCRKHFIDWKNLLLLKRQLFPILLSTTDENLERSTCCNLTMSLLLSFWWPNICFDLQD